MLIRICTSTSELGIIRLTPGHIKIQLSSLRAPVPVHFKFDKCLEGANSAVVPAVLQSRSRWSGNFLPEPKFFWPSSGAGYVNSYNMLQKP
jgi:hypothetical protein